MAPVAGLAPAIYRFKGGCNTLCYTGNPFSIPIENGKSNNGFEATLAAMKTLGMDISCVPTAILQAFYTSGVVFSEDDGMSPDERKRWRESVLNPKMNGRGPRMALTCALSKK